LGPRAWANTTQRMNRSLLYALAHVTSIEHYSQSS
jgi:hypothetical protein